MKDKTKRPTPYRPHTSCFSLNNYRVFLSLNFDPPQNRLTNMYQKGSLFSYEVYLLYLTHIQSGN